MFWSECQSLNEGMKQKCKFGLLWTRNSCWNSSEVRTHTSCLLLICSTQFQPTPGSEPLSGQQEKADIRIFIAVGSPQPTMHFRGPAKQCAHVAFSALKRGASCSRCRPTVNLFSNLARKLINEFSLITSLSASAIVSGPWTDEATLQCSSAQSVAEVYEGIPTASSVTQSVVLAVSRSPAAFIYNYYETNRIPRQACKPV